MEGHTLNMPWKLYLEFDKLWVGEGKPSKFESQRFSAIVLKPGLAGWLGICFLLLVHGAHGQL